jgi:hypothetical protein
MNQVRRNRRGCGSPADGAERPCTPQCWSAADDPFWLGQRPGQVHQGEMEVLTSISRDVTKAAVQETAAQRTHFSSNTT